jgi:CHASE2 domain-containing sensor protein
MTFDYLTSVWSFFLFVLIVLPAGYLVFSLTNRSKDSKRIDIGVILTCGVVVWLLLSFSFAAIGQLRNMFFARCIGRVDCFLFLFCFAS